MKVLVVNAGSSSLKYQLFDMRKEKLLAKGNCQKIGETGSFFDFKKDGFKKEFQGDLKDHTVALKKVLSVLMDKEIGVISSPDEISAIGHRVLHGGEIYKSSVVITPEVMKNLKKLVPLGPLHMPANILGIEVCQKVFKGKPNVAVFDTAFHSSMPESSYMYAVPYEWYTKYGVRRYGFHGISHNYIAQTVEKLEGRKDLKIISCHIGSGASLSAIKNGKCVETTMGLTPLEGLVMGTRSGDLDPAILEFVMEKEGMDILKYLHHLLEDYLGTYVLQLLVP